ncbi:MAG: DUF1573 domain-containing protein [Bacteroidetes bacterium]|nr:DUF1573 domain-containing protein [Bacteroidota bacterium]
MRTLFFTLPALLLAFFFPVTANCQSMSNTDPSKNAGKVSWEPRRLDLGEIPFGIPVTRDYVVKNTSKEPLVLTSVKSGCHCTTVTWSQESVMPGDSTRIHATYDASKEGPFYKIITVVTNFDPEQAVALTLTGSVLPKPETH